MSGSDSYTAEFFKFLFVDVGSFIVRSINCRFSKGEMSVTQRQGIITCIPKEEKKKTLLNNWGPVTVLKIVHRIASSYIAGKLKTVSPQLINVDQKGFLKGRYTGENIKWLYDSLLYASKHKVPGLVLMKTFASVALFSTQRSLTVFNFGRYIKKINFNRLR